MEYFFKEIRVENFSNLGKELIIQVSEAKRTPGYLNVMRPTSKHSAYTIKSSKQRIVKVVGGKGPIYKSTPIRLSLDFSRTSVDQERME